MKKTIFILSILSLVLALAFVAAAAEDYNYALGKTPLGTFTKATAAVDNSSASFAVSGDLTDSPQFFTIDLGKSIYIGSIKLVWDGKALSNDYSIRVSSDAKNWFTEFSGLNAASGAREGVGNVSQLISTQRYTIPARYIQVYIPVGSQASAKQVRIADVQVKEAKGLKFELTEVRPYVITDKSAIVVYKTSIGAIGGKVIYGRDPAKLDMIGTNIDSGLANSAVLTGLTPGLAYFYKVEATDGYGRTIASAVNTLNPARANLALNKPVSGTFTAFPPNDNLVDRSKDVISRVADGVTGYFKGMATSGSVKKQNQEAVIDLGSNYPINSIVCYWRALAYPEDFTVQVSSDGTNWRNLANNLNAALGAGARSDAGDPMRVTATEGKGASARYVKVLIKKDSPFYAKHANWDFVQLMEVEVF